MKNYREGVYSILTNFKAAGEIVFTVNGHATVQILALSPPSKQFVLIDRILCRELKSTREAAVNLVWKITEENNIPSEQIHLIMDGWSRVPLKTYNDVVIPI